MTISTRAELIKQLQKGNPDEVLVYTYWGDSDFEIYTNKDKARELIDASLKYSAIGEANDFLRMEYKLTKEKENNTYTHTCETCGVKFESDDDGDDGWLRMYCPEHKVEEE